jgi:hypothetical protein
MSQDDQFIAFEGGIEKTTALVYPIEKEPS